MHPTSIIKFKFKNIKIAKHQNIQQSNSSNHNKKSVLRYSQPIQENKLVIIISLRSYNLPTAHYHSYNKRKRENSLLLTSNEAIPQQGKRRQSHDHPMIRLTQWLCPPRSSWQLLLWQNLGCDLKHNHKRSPLNLSSYSFSPSKLELPSTKPCFSSL